MAEHQIYWAAPFFDSAWIAYNARCVALLRGAGFAVFAPQEQQFNRATHDPTAVEVFDEDHRAIQSSRLIVTAIDGETIDCAVAAEAGLAYAYGIPIIGLYTDLRQHRAGLGRSYRNLFVVGLIERSGCLISDEGQLAGAVRRHLEKNEASGV